MEVLGFAEAGAPVTIPGPLIRVPQGTEVRIRVRNAIPEGYPIGLPLPAFREEGVRSVADDVLVVRGLRAGTASDDVLRVPRGEVAEVRYRADIPGTYFYWATPSLRSIRAWTGPDSQLAGAIIVDPEGVAPDPEERIFVITLLDQLPDPDAPIPQGDFFRRAINGRSWPDTERFEYAVGDTVRWRWINASFDFHPMHLHGFHFQLTARGDGTSETIFPREERPLVVTEAMAPGSTFRMEWVPIRGGNWIFHCHILDHVVPTVERDEAEREHDHVFVIAGQAEGDYLATINGQPEPPVMTFRAGETYRLRFIHITQGMTADIALTGNGAPVRWRAVAKDGADLPEALQLDSDAEFSTNTGETFDFLWTPIEPGEATLIVRYERFFEVEEGVLRKALRVE